VALACALSLLPAVNARASEADAAEIREAFAGYREALLEGDGEAAARALSRSTHDYYGRIRELALNAAAARVHDESVADQLQILLYRARVPRALLESMSATGLIAYSIEEGWIARESVARIEASQVDVRGSEAMLHVRSAEKELGPAFFYRREAGGWRLDLVPVMRATERPLRNAALRENMEIGEYLLAVVERAVGREIGAEIWIPLRERDADGAPLLEAEG